MKNIRKKYQPLLWRILAQRTEEKKKARRLTTCPPLYPRLRKETKNSYRPQQNFWPRDFGFLTLNYLFQPSLRNLGFFICLFASEKGLFPDAHPISVIGLLLNGA